MQEWALIYKNNLRNIFKYKTKFGNVFLDETHSGISKVIAMYGSREDDKQKLLKTSIEPKTVYVDLWSNIGVYPLFISNLLDSDSFLISIEPDTRNHKTLLKNLDNCFIEKIFLPYAISDKDSISKLLISKETILPPVPTTTSIVALDPLPPVSGMSMYGEGSSIVKVGIFDVVYPLPGLTTVILVTIPALLIWALNNASY